MKNEPKFTAQTAPSADTAEYLAGEVNDAHMFLAVARAEGDVLPGCWSRVIPTDDPLVFDFLHAHRIFRLRLREGSEPLVRMPGASAQLVGSRNATYRDLEADEITSLQIAVDPLYPANRLTI